MENQMQKKKEHVVETEVVKGLTKFFINSIMDKLVHDPLHQKYVAGNGQVWPTPRT